MAPMRQKKPQSNSPLAEPREQPRTADAQSGAMVALKDSRRLHKKQTRAITASQKQALIDNLQLEVTERARRLRAQYSIQAQNLRSRLEIRVNRIPLSLRRMKMGDLLAKYQRQQHQPRLHVSPQKSAAAAPKPAAPKSTAPHDPSRLVSGPSDARSGDKENEGSKADGKRKARGAGQAADAGHVVPAQVLSPTSSNSRIVGRDVAMSPFKSQIARPGSPLKPQATHRSAAVVLSSMVEKAKATRHGGIRKTTAASDASSASSTTCAATKNRRPLTATGSRAPPSRPPSRPATRAAKRASGTSEASQGSTATVVNRADATRPAPTTKKTTMGVIKRGVVGAGVKKTAAKTSAAAASSKPSGGRVLRRRG
ncbi:hypothetical protein CDD82_6114 [Ophiocordyceps australis]|uniref:Borealin N-terminal domain-containing protein n=1 Tax=Ophiocordyceps australis TaxID=1399860 RepID=A0A2C5Y2A5_9HYPO|nr:hypothetical protein CDD82_6114 [Ophiocordyceps australis]